MGGLGWVVFFVGFFVCFFVVVFFFFLGGGGLGVVVLPGWLHVPLHGYYQIILVVYGRLVILGEVTNHHYSFL